MTARALVPRLADVSGYGRTSSDEVAGWLRTTCAAAAQVLPASGVGVSLMTAAGLLGVAATSDDVTLALGRLQSTLGEGPCFDAFAGHGPVLVPDLNGPAADRWPGYAPAAVALGIRSVCAFPLQVGAARLGVMDVYRHEPGTLSIRSTGLALAFADLVIEGLLDAQDGVAAAPAVAGLDDVLGSHYVVYQAQGMTMVDLGVTLVDALARLRAHAFSEGRTLHDVARDIVDGRLRLEPDTP